MLQTKIFTGTDSTKLEQAMNRWLETMWEYEYTFEVKQTKYLATQVGTRIRYNVLVIYGT